LLKFTKIEKMEPLTLTEDQIVVKQFPTGSADDQAKTLTPNYTVANDDTDGTDGSDDAADSVDTDGTDGA
jgi:hypothetical protein